MRCVIHIAVLSVSIFAQSESAIATGRVRGAVVDVTGAAIRASIRVRQQPLGSIVLRFSAADSGAFLSDQLPAGVYSMTFYAAGFRRRELRSVLVEAGRTTALGEIKLDLSGCDSTMTCNSIGPAPPSFERIIASAHVELKIRCAPICTSEPVAGIRLARENGTLYLIAEKGAAISTVEPPDTECSGVKFRNKRLSVAGFGPGVDFCVRTSRGSISHVFFEDDVENESSVVRLWYVTRRSMRGP